MIKKSKKMPSINNFLCCLNPVSKRKKFYETILELSNRFSKIFAGRIIGTGEKCPNPKCNEKIHDLHIRLGWSMSNQDYRTICPKCHDRFVARFWIKENHRVCLHENFEFFVCRNF